MVFLFVPLRVMVSLKPYSTQRVRKRGGGEGGGAKMRLCVGDVVNRGGEGEKKREIKSKKSWKRRHSKLYRYTIHR